MRICPNFSLHRWPTTQWTLDWLGVTPDKTNPFSFCVTEKLTFVNVCYFHSSPGNVSLQYKIFSWEKSVPNTNRIIMVMRLAGFLFGRYRMGLLVSSSLYSGVSHTLSYIDIPSCLSIIIIDKFHNDWPREINTSCPVPTYLYLPIYSTYYLGNKNL